MILSNKELGKYLRDIREQLGYSIYYVTFPLVIYL